MYKAILSILATQVVALPAPSGHSVAQLFKRDDGHGMPGGGHGMPKGGHSDGGHGMSGAKGGMSGGMGAAKGTLNDFMATSALTQPMLEMVLPMMPPAKRFRTEEKAVKTKRPGAKSMSVWYGPFELMSKEDKLKAGNKDLLGLDPQGTSFNMRAENFPGDITLLSASARLVYENGSPANGTNGVYNHHITFADVSKKPLAMMACPGKKAKPAMALSITVGTGEDGNFYQYAPENKDSFNGGYYIGKGDKIFITNELVNYSSEKKTVYTVIDMEYMPGKGEHDVSSETISVTACAGSTNIRPPPGQKKFSLQSEPMTIQEDGEIFGVRGHLHDGGVSIPVMVNGKVVCESKANYAKNAGSASSLTSMTTCDGPIAVKKGDKLSLAAGYDLEKYPARQHADGNEAEEMGVIMFSFAANKPTVGTKKGSVTGLMEGLLDTLAEMYPKSKST